MNCRTALFATLTTLAFGAAPAVAQMSDNAMMLGFKGGATFSKASVEDAGDVDLSYLTAIGGGVFLKLPLGSVGLQPEALWVRKGASVSGADFGAGTSVDLKLDYIEVPVLLVVPVGSGNAAPYVFGGGAVAFETGCTFSLSGGGLNIDADCDNNDEDLELTRKSTDFSAVFGAGVRLPVGSGAFLLEGRYTLGLADLNDSGQSSESFKNRTFAAYLGYAINIGG